MRRPRAPVLFRIPHSAFRIFLLPLLVAALLLEHVALPYPARPAPAVPAFYQHLAASDEAGVILEWPFSLKRPESMYYQTVHGRPIVGGYLSRRLTYPLRTLPPLAEPAPDITRGADDLAALGARVLAYSGVQWIVVLLDDEYLDRAALLDFLHRYAEPEPLYQDARTAVYRPRPPRGPVLYVETGDGWYLRETNAGTTTLMRWFGSRAILTAWNLGESTQAAVLRFDARSFDRPRWLEVGLDGRVLGQWLVTDPQRFDIPLTLPPGSHRIELRALDPPTSPASVGHNTDERPLSFSISKVELHQLHQQR